MKKRPLMDTFLTLVLTVLCVVWVYPVLMILFNSLKLETAISTNTVFQLPNAQTFAGLYNFVNAVGSKGFVDAFCTSLVITITSVAAILLLCSMCAWYITRVENVFTKLCYFLFVFSMIHVCSICMIWAASPKMNAYLHGALRLATSFLIGAMLGILSMTRRFVPGMTGFMSCNLV